MGARGGKSRAKKTPPPSVELSAVLYGPESLSQDLADYLEECGLYLQDPRACDRNVVYINPQALAELEGVPLWTQEMRAVHDHETEIFQAPANVLADLENDEELVETIDPCALATPLFKHQRQALTFMHRRERGWAFYGPHYDIWQACSTANSAYGFTNTVSDEVVSEPPAQFRGGILADDMGLGKSLTCIALIASDKDSIDLTSPRKQSLIVVRAPLLETWETQLRRHVRPDALSWRRHHGRDKIKIAEELRPHDIVVTTYQTLLSEWRRNDCGHQPMYAHDWHRIILDEAHDIREGSRATARAIRALRATCRWTVTGTPIQNRLSDLASLYQFLRACPYDDPLVFQDHVRRLGRFGNEEALQRLRRLVCSIMLRRSIGTVELPRREDLLVRLDFSEAELALYNRVGTSTLRILDSASTGAVETQGKGNILTCINNLRQICNLGVHARVSVPSHDNQMSPAPQAWSGEVAQQAYNSLVTIGQAICASCGANQDTASSEVADQVGNALQPSLSSCSRLLCGPCRDSHGVDCTHSPQHAWYAVSSMSSATNNAVTPSSIESDDLPTKIKALASDLEMHTLEEKCVVFSFWTSTLDVIEQTLQARAIGYIRFDGKVSNSKRVKVLKDFRENPSIRVALLTISCGAVGLDLTAASRAYLMEPHWNPSVEQQALARIYRVGQQRPVTTLRYVMRDSFEDHVLKIQEDKQLLAELYLSHEPKSNASAEKARLQNLRRLIEPMVDG